MRLDYLIVGQGIAGTALTHLLLERGKRIKIIDQENLSSSSKVAAGLFNPIVFKRLVKSWMADELIPFTKNFYQHAEAVYGKSFFIEREIVKILTEEKEEKLWREKMLSAAENYLKAPQRENIFPEHLTENYGYASVQRAGNVNIKEFLLSVKAVLSEKKILLEEKFDHAKLKFSEEEISYREIKARKIIFCEGYQAINNPLFFWLPFKLTKGELLTVKIKGLKTEQVLNKGVFVLPVGEAIFKVGATYEWDDLNENITEKGKQELSDKLKKIIKAPFEIIEQEAGIRPTVFDRRPIIGAHPEHKNIFVFNGMGTKGVMLAPYFANQLIAHIEEGDKLNPEVDIMRCKKYFPN